MRESVSSDRIVVVKIGGSTLGSHDTTLEDVVRLQRDGYSPVVVHGGGKTITDWLNRLQIPSSFVRGLRVTDKSSIDVVVSVLAGLVNKDLVASINRLGGRAAGFSGVDGELFSAEPLDAELGLVGRVVKVDTQLVDICLRSDLIPVIAPIGVSSPSSGAILYNINADTAAGQLAASLSARFIVFLTDVPGIAGSDGKVIAALSPQTASALIGSGVASGGMIPKIEACLTALEAGGAAYIVDGRIAGSLVNIISGTPSGTVLKKG